MLDWIGRVFGRKAPEVEQAPAAMVQTRRPEPAARAATRPEPELECALSRQDLFDALQRPIGYLFSLNEGRQSGLRAVSARVRQLFDNQLVSELQKLVPNWPANRFAILPLDEASLGLQRLPALAPLRPVLLVDVERQPQAETAERIAVLRAAGLRIALQARPGMPRFEDLAASVDSFIIDFSTREPAELSMLAEELSARFPSASRIALRVEDAEEFDMATSFGCQVIGGSFSQVRDDWSGNRIAPNHLRIAELLSRVGQGGETQEIASTLKQDVALSYRLLRYVNSAAMGLQSEIGSIEQALMMLGQRALLRWLSLLFFSSTGNKGEQSPLMETALVRGRMMERLGTKLFRDQGDDLFVTGVFSLLDLVLRVPMAEALEPLHLAAPIRAALLERKGPYATLLAAAVACEEGDLVRLRDACKELGTVPMVVCGAHIDALAWVHELEAQTPPKCG